MIQVVTQKPVRDFRVGSHLAAGLQLPSLFACNKTVAQENLRKFMTQGTGVSRTKSRTVLLFHTACHHHSQLQLFCGPPSS
jgi:hypothetical protein